jgi:hypothetical protein
MKRHDYKRFDEDNSKLDGYDESSGNVVHSSWALHILQLETIVIIRLNMLRTIFY